MQLKIQELIISFKKFLIAHFGKITSYYKHIRKYQTAQSILEYSLLLVAVAALSLAILWPKVCNGQNNIFTSVVDKINQRVVGSP